MKIIWITQGQFTLVDDCHYDIVKNYNWSALKSGNTKKTFYAKTNEGKIYLHRLILGINDKNLVVDHKDGNGLNNQTSNLRVTTQAKNIAAKRISSRQDKVSKYKGVMLEKRNGTWIAVIQSNKVRKHIGTFSTEDDAAIAYNQAAQKLHGEFANLNKVLI